MKRIFVNEEWCLGCHLCEYRCAFANSGMTDMAKALKGKPIFPRLRVKGDITLSYPVVCRHCREPQCMKSCIAGAIHAENGIITVDPEKCIGCLTCVLTCPYGAIAVDPSGFPYKCELCSKQNGGHPACVSGCPNGAIVFEERECE